MLAGVERGFDAPSTEMSLCVLSDIFLRPIKVIVALLILATLVTGIAGRGNLKSVGRMEVKSLVYIEVVTPLALVIGLVSIDFSEAGVGLTLPRRQRPDGYGANHGQRRGQLPRQRRRSPAEAEFR